MASERSLGAVLERAGARLRSSPTVQRWARARLRDLDELGGGVTAIAAAVGLGVVAAMVGWFGTENHLRELLEELAGARGERCSQ